MNDVTVKDNVENGYEEQCRIKKLENWHIRLKEGMNGWRGMVWVSHETETKMEPDAQSVACLIDAGLMRRWLSKLLEMTIPEYRSMMHEWSIIFKLEQTGGRWNGASGCFCRADWWMCYCSEDLKIVRSATNHYHAAIIKAKRTYNSSFISSSSTTLGISTKFYINLVDNQFRSTFAVSNRWIPRARPWARWAYLRPLNASWEK